MKTVSFVLGAVLAILGTAAPSFAKPVSLKCSSWDFYLNEDKEQYSTSYNGNVINGVATYYPHQINLILPVSNADATAIEWDITINRKTLEYIADLRRRLVVGRGSKYEIDSGWISSGKPLTGVCTINKNPTAGNKI